MNNEWAMIKKVGYTGFDSDVKTLTVTIQTNSKSLPLQQVMSGDMGSTILLFDKLREIAREPVRNIISAGMVSDEDIKKLEEMLNRAPPAPICYGGEWPDDEEEEEMNEQEEQETQKRFVKAGMDHAVFCIIQEMMEDFNPNTVMINILTDLIATYKVYAKRSKIPERVRNDVIYGLEHIIETIRRNNRDQKEE